MADPLYELLAPFFDNEASPPSPRDADTTNYLTRLSTLSLSDLTSTEPASLLQSAQSHIRNLQALSKRSHKAVISSTAHLRSLSSILPAVGTQAAQLQTVLPGLEETTNEFVQKYDRSTENAVLDRRKRAMLLSRNVDRVSDVLDLPSLLSSTVSAAQNGNAGASASSANNSFASALDLHAHIRRLNALYPQSELVGTISEQSESEMQNLATILISSLQSPSLKLAAAMRTIGLLRRVAPDLACEGSGASNSGALSTRNIGLLPSSASDDGAFGALFLLCRLQTLHKTFEALDPLRDLADQESGQLRKRAANGKASKPQPNTTSALGSQSERYLKRYIDIFREQSFAILSMYKSIFPANLPTPDPGRAESDAGAASDSPTDPLLPLPPPISSFALHVADMLASTLREYLPNVGDKSARESLFTQVLYCAGSLGRLGAEFGMLVALLEDDFRTNHGDAADDDAEPEWVLVMKRHRVQASRLEILARGVGTGVRKASVEVQSPGGATPGTPLTVG